jgi:hypothetical protein
MSDSKEAHADMILPLQRKRSRDVEDDFDVPIQPLEKVDLMLAADVSSSCADKICRGFVLWQAERLSILFQHCPHGRNLQILVSRRLSMISNVAATNHQNPISPKPGAQ